MTIVIVSCHIMKYLSDCTYTSLFKKCTVVSSTAFKPVTLTELHI